MRLTIIAALSQNYCIGKGGQLPWRLKDDMRHFVRRTVGHTVMMGRKTYESIGKVLPNRKNIIISSTLPQVDSGAVLARSLDEALTLTAEDKEVFIIGGAHIYEQTLPLADYLCLSRVDVVCDGDAFFPYFSLEQWVLEKAQEFERGEGNEYRFSIEEYRRKMIYSDNEETRLHQPDTRTDRGTASPHGTDSA